MEESNFDNSLTSTAVEISEAIPDKFAVWERKVQTAAGDNLLVTTRREPVPLSKTREVRHIETSLWKLNPDGTEVVLSGESSDIDSPVFASEFPTEIMFGCSPNEITDDQLSEINKAYGLLASQGLNLQQIEQRITDFVQGHRRPDIRSTMKDFLDEETKKLESSK